MIFFQNVCCGCMLQGKVTALDEIHIFNCTISRVGMEAVKLAVKWNISPLTLKTDASVFDIYQQ